MRFRLRTLLTWTILGTWIAAAFGALIVCASCLHSIWQEVENY